MFPCTLPLKFHKDSFITPRAVLSLALFNGFRVLGLGLGPKGNNKPNIFIKYRLMILLEFTNILNDYLHNIIYIYMYIQLLYILSCFYDS